MVAERKSVGEINYWISKDGYYETSGRLNFERNGVKDGRWQPYGKTNTVVLKRKINPVAMCVKPISEGIHSPIKNECIGFDLEKGDWVQPHGQGVVTDFTLKYEYEAGAVPLLYYRGSVFFSFTNQYDGAYVMKKDTFSSFMSVYEADTNAVYHKSFAFVYDRLSGKIVENSKFPDSDYLVLRTRSKTDENGNLVSAYYAKIYGPIAAGGGGIYMGYHFNPNENDPNLEADTNQNLLPPHQLNFSP